ncbi:MAG: DUF2807 domain-containing protein [Rikenellaceae bacterium]
MKKRIFLILALLLVGYYASCEQLITSKTMADFNTIELRGNLTVELSEDTSNSIEIELFGCDITKIRWAVENDKLSVTLKTPTSEVNARANVKISYKNLRTLEAYSSSVKSTTPMSQDMLDIKASSGAIVNIQVQSLDVKVDALQNSVVQLEGISRYLIVNAEDRSKVDMRSLSSVSVNAQGSGQAEIYVLAQQRLVASAKTGATVYYLGEPRLLRAFTPKIIKFGASIENLK